jgi:signal transduction histidine kinase
MKKDLRLTSFFSLVSIPILLLAVVLLVFLYRLVVLDTLQRQVEQNNITVARSLSNIVWDQIEVLEDMPTSKKATSINDIYLDIISKDVFKFLRGTSVLKVVFYNNNGKTVYSTDRKEVGEVKSESYLGMRTAMNGAPYSSMTKEEQFHSIKGVLRNIILLETYIPKINEKSNKVEGVFEIYTDVSNPLREIDHNLMKFVGILVVIFSFIYVALHIRIRYADKVISRNKDELKQKIKEIERMNSILEKNTKDLELARDMANHANIAKSQFLANMSHELRTPLNAILGYTEMITEASQKYADDEIDNDLTKVHRAGKHLLELINSILDLSKIEADQMELHYETFDVSHLLQEVADTISPIMQQNHNEMKFEINFKDVIMYGDVTKIRQILFNLVSNSAKFTTNGTVSLTSSLQIINNDKKIIFEVSDTGIGIPQGNIEKLFDPFEQGDSSTTRKYGGTGLGLTITKRFCTMMNGEIEVDSEEGKGTRFIVYLPFTEAQAESRAAS